MSKPDHSKVRWCVWKRACTWRFNLSAKFRTIVKKKKFMCRLDSLIRGSVGFVIKCVSVLRDN